MSRGDEDETAINVKGRRTAASVQRSKLERLMKNPDKPVHIPEKRPEKDPNARAPEFVYNVMGSSAGAGSGEFHVYRQLRRREANRMKVLGTRKEFEELNEAYHQKLEENEKAAQERIEKNRKKRLKKKERAKKRKMMKKMEKKQDSKKSSSSSSDSDSDENSGDEDKEKSDDAQKKDSKETEAKKSEQAEPDTDNAGNDQSR